MLNSDAPSSKAQEPKWVPTPAKALKIAGLYALTASLWIYFSGKALHYFVTDPKMVSILEDLKGWFFVVVTAGLLSIALIRYFRLIRNSAYRLAESENQVRLALEATQMGSFEWDMVANRLNWTHWHQKIWGYGPGEFDGSYEAFIKRIHPDDRDALKAQIDRCVQSHTNYKSEFRLVWPDGTIHWVAAAGEFFFDSQQRPLQMRGTVIEITQRKQVEQLQVLSGEILTILNDRQALQDATQRILNAIKRVTGFNAVGIRLRQGQDFPYFVASGFSQCFLQFENQLACRSESGEFCRDEKGNIRLECTCGMVISGQVDPANPLFSPGGSAWTNDALPTSNIPADKDPRLNPRNRCVHEGYQSIALIPIRMNGEIIGLLQLNDHRKGCFTLEMIRYFEGIAASFGVAMLRLRQEQALRESERNLRSLFDAIPESLVLVENDGKIVTANATFANRWNTTIDASMGACLYDVLPSDAAKERREWVAEVLQNHKPVIREIERNNRIYRHSTCPVFETNGQVRRVVGFAVDVTDQHAAEKALQASELQYRLTLDGMLEGCQIISRDWTYLYLNETAYRHSRRPLNSLLGKNYLAEWPGIESTQVHAYIKQCLENGAPQRMENEFTFPDGSVGCFELSIQPVPQGVFILSIDITERKQTEAERRKWADAFEHCAHGIGIGSTATNRIVICNPALARMLHRTVQDITGGLVTSLYAPADKEHVTKSIAQADREGQIRYQARMVRSDGSFFPVQMDVVVVRDAQGRPQYRVATAQDVTERLAAEAALTASEERFRILVENAPDGIFVQSMGKFRFINKAAARLFGAAAPEVMIGGSVMNHIHPEDQALVAERMRVVNVEQKPIPLSAERMVRLDKSVFDAEISAAPVVFEGVSSALIFFQDITERKRLEAQFRQVQKLEAIGQLAGGVAHDFNNILSATMMHLSLLQMNPNLDDETRSTLNEIEAEARRAATLTRQLLMFSRRSVLAVKPLDMNEVIGNLLKMLNRLIGEDINLRFEGKTGLPQIEADAGMMEQVIMNLVVNARDAMPRGGRIGINTSVAAFEATPTTGSQGERAGRFVCLTISDTGVGMSPEVLKQIFVPFFTTKEAGKGTGLGLATVHGIVAQHKGWVQVESEVAVGTTFRVYLPVAETVPEGTEQMETQHSIPRGNETILMVEDEGEVRHMISKVLRALGYAVHEAANGIEALSLWEIHRAQIDLLLTDMVMPEGMTGLELVERLQEIKPDLKAIISSGYSNEIAQAGVPQKKGLLYLPKPYEMDVLAETVRKCLDQKS